MLEDQVVIYIDGYLDRSYQFNRGENIPEDEFYDLKQAIVIHQSGDIDLHFDTTAPIAEMHADLSADEEEFGRYSERFYSGVVIPEALTGGNALLFVNHITSGGQHSYSLTGAQIAAIEELPTDGAPFDAGAPVKAVTPHMDSLYIPDSYATYSENNVVALDVKLNAGETYSWTMRNLIQEMYVENEITEYYVITGEWSESSSFTVLEEDKDENELLGAIGYLNLLLALVLVRRFK